MHMHPCVHAPMCSCTHSNVCLHMQMCVHTLAYHTRKWKIIKNLKVKALYRKHHKYCINGVKIESILCNSRIGKHWLVIGLAQQVEILTTESEKLSSVPRTHVVEGHRTNSWELSSDHWHTMASTGHHKINITNNFKKKNMSILRCCLV